MDRNGLAEAEVADDAAEGALDAGALHGAVGGGGAGGDRGRWRGRARWDGDAWPSIRGGSSACSTGSGTKRSLAPLPRWTWTIIRAAVDVADLEMEALGEPEAERVDGPEVGAVVGRADGGDEPSDLVDGEDVGKALLPRDAELLERGPVAWDGVGIEELDAAVGDAEGSGGEVAVVLEVEEVVAELRLGEAVGRGVEVVGEMPDGAEVGVLGALAEAGELEVLGHAEAECGGHVMVLWSGMRRSPLPGTMAHETVACAGSRDRREWR